MYVVNEYARIIQNGKTPLLDKHLLHKTIFAPFAVSTPVFFKHFAAG